jgi:hypothetical protein
MNLNEVSVVHQQVIEAMKDQMLIVLIQRLGGKVEIPIDEVDGTGAFNLTMWLDSDAKKFVFEAVSKRAPDAV